MHLPHDIILHAGLVYLTFKTLTVYCVHRLFHHSMEYKNSAIHRVRYEPCNIGLYQPLVATGRPIRIEDSIWLEDSSYHIILLH